MTKIEAFGFSDKQEEQIEQEEISSVEVLSGLIGTKIVEIRDYQSESAEDWIKNFKEGLNGIEILINSKDAVRFCDESVLEKVPSRIGVLMENLNNFNLDKLSEEEKNILLEKLNNLFN